MGPIPRARHRSAFRATRTSVSTRNLVAVGLVLASACSSHGSRGGGPHDYVRCMAVDAPDETSGRIGDVSYRSDERALALSGLTAPLRIAAFRGASGATAGLAEAALGVTEQRPGLVVVLGGLGPDVASVRAHFTAFEKLRVPTVVLPGGDDVAEAVGEAFEAGAPANVLDGRRFRRIETDVVDLLLLSGAPDGRYASSSAHCGNDGDDRDELETRSGKRSVLVSWAAPSGGGAFAVGRGFDGVDSGDPRVATLAHALGDLGGIFAFPATRAAIPTSVDGRAVLGANEAAPSSRIVAPRLAGPADERDDFGLVPSGAVILEYGADGVSFVGVSASEGG